jgi:proteic killer suppression protein
MRLTLARSVNQQLTPCRLCFTLDTVIVSFRHAGLRELFETGKSRKVQPDLHKRCRRAMDALHAATAVSDLNMPGWSVHPLKGNREGRHAMAVSGPWRITFRWDGKDAHELALEQYH